MAGADRQKTEKVIEQVKEAVDRLAEVLDTLLRGHRPAPAVIPVRRPMPQTRRRRDY